MKLLLAAAFFTVGATARAGDAPTQAEREALQRSAAAAKQEAVRAAEGKLESQACPAEQRVVHTVDLDRPGAFTELKKSNRDHFVRLFAMQEPRPRPIHETWRWMHADAKACDVTMLNFYRTSLPAQALLSFVLDDTRYTRTVYVEQGW